MNNQEKSKERQISQVVEKVKHWRQLYNGFSDKNGNLIRMPLEAAARKIGIPKKSLDDYLLNIRYGKKYGFDFEKHKDSNFGVLR